MKKMNLNICKRMNKKNVFSVNGIDIRKVPFTEHSSFWEKIDKASLIILRNGEEKNIEFDLNYIL